MPKRFITPEMVMTNRFLAYPRPQWDCAVVCFRDYQGSQILVNAFDARPLGYKAIYGMEECAEFPIVYETEILGRRIGIVTRCNWGAPQAAIIVEELATLGVTSIIGYGAAGSIQRDLTRGTQLMVRSALCNDGTSQVYHKDATSVGGSVTLRTRAQVAAQRLGHPLIEVSAATVDALYRETDELVSQWQAAGAEIINMESGALYATSESCGIRSLWLGFVSDCLVEEGWQDWHVNLSEMAEITAAICLETVRDCVGI